MHITKKTKLYFIIASVLLVLCIGFSFFIHRHIAHRGGELLAYIKTVAEYTDREQKYSELSRLIAATQEDREELHTYILKRSETIDFLAEVEEIAKAKQVELSTDRLEEEVTDTQFDTLVVTFALRGTDKNVRDMIRIFETVPYHSTVTSIVITEKGATQEEDIDAVIELVVSLNNV